MIIPIKMENILRSHLPEIVFASSEPTVSRQISKLEKEGRLIKISPRIYTSNLLDSSEVIIQRNLFLILGKLYPGAVLSHRSAFEFRPTASNQIFLTYSYTKKIPLPGLTIRFLEGKGNVLGDTQLSDGLYASQRARAFLENLQVSRNSDSTSKCLSMREIEDKLEQIIRINGESEIKKVKDNARRIADELGMIKEFERLNKLISALLSTQPAKILSSPIAKARALGVPYDQDRIELLGKLFRELQGREFKNLPDRNRSEISFKNFAFFESYFSNYIEGTIFEIGEAKEIIESSMPLASRNDDSHDVLGTYQIVSSRIEMSKIPTGPEELLDILQYRHAILLRARESKNPGLFKDKNNFAGQTAFVDFNLVRGTLLQSYDLYNSLEHPFSRAIFMMFMISEVHPFLDGNGRIARVMMNAELVKAQQTKIIIPTVFREDYMGALRKLTRQKEPDAYIRMMQRAQEFSDTIFSDDQTKMQEYLVLTNAFFEPSEARLEIIPR